MTTAATFAVNGTRYDSDESCYECDDLLDGLGVQIVRDNGRGSLALTHHCSSDHAAEYIAAESDRWQA